MSEELDLLGVFVPAAVAWAVLAALLAWWLRPWLQRATWARFVWHPGLLELGLFVALWWGLSALADRFLPAGVLPHP